MSASYQEKQGFQGSRGQGFKGSRVQGFKGSRGQEVHAYTFAGIREPTNPWTLLFKVFPARQKRTGFEPGQEVIEPGMGPIEIQIVFEAPKAPCLPHSRLIGIELPGVKVKHISPFGLKNAGCPSLKQGDRPKPEVAPSSEGNVHPSDPEAAYGDFLDRAEMGQVNERMSG